MNLPLANNKIRGKINETVPKCQSKNKIILICEVSSVIPTIWENIWETKQLKRRKNLRSENKRYTKFHDVGKLEIPNVPKQKFVFRKVNKVENFAMPIRCSLKNLIRAVADFAAVYGNNEGTSVGITPNKIKLRHSSFQWLPRQRPTATITFPCSCKMGS